MLALGKLWIWAVEGVPRAVGEVPDGAYHLSWSGDGDEVVFTTGDLFAADVETGALRQLTALPGEAGFPTWSPDGRHIAFIHEGWDLSEGWGHARVIPADGVVVEDLAQTIDLGRVPGSDWGRDQPAWGPDSRDILLYGTDGLGTTRATLATLDGGAREVHLPRSSSFVSRAGSDSMLYVHGARLWTASFTRDSGSVGVPTPISEGPALYASASTDGAILYVSSGGLCLLTPTGETRELGWPLRSMTPPSPASLVIRNARIVDGSGGPASGPHDLVIADGRIVRIAPAGTVAPEDRSTMLDAGGRYVIPGLIDLHQHIWSPHPPLEGGLYHGVTTVRDVGSSIAWSAAQRDLVDAGLRPGPRIVLGGSFFLSGDGLSKDAGLFVADSAQAARGIALVKGFGATYVKHYYDGWAGLKSIIDEAHRQGMPVTVHCASILPIVAAGVDGQEHTGSCVRDERGIYADYVRIKTAADIPIVSDAGYNLLFLQLLARPEDYQQPDIRPFLGFGTPTANTYEPANRERNRAMFELGTDRQRTRTNQLYEAGPTVAAGTDLWFPTAMHSALKGMVAAGLSPAEAIAAATSVAARVLGAESEIGTIEPGKLADLVILDADPLEDISNIRRVWQVIQGGRIVDRGALIEFVRASPTLASGPDYGY